MVQRIFLADDDLNVRQALRLLLEQAGFTIAGEASSVERLLDQVSKARPEIILIDWELPGMKAKDLLSELRRCCPETKIIALSVRTEAQPIALSVGVDAFASKGNPSDELLAILHSLDDKDM